MVRWLTATTRIESGAIQHDTGFRISRVRPGNDTVPLANSGIFPIEPICAAMMCNAHCVNLPFPLPANCAGIGGVGYDLRGNHSCTRVRGGGRRLTVVGDSDHVCNPIPE